MGMGLQLVLCSDWHSDFLTYTVVLAFFKISCVLVTEKTEQPHKAEVTTWAHTSLRCMS